MDREDMSHSESVTLVTSFPSQVLWAMRRCSLKYCEGSLGGTSIKQGEHK